MRDWWGAATGVWGFEAHLHRVLPESIIWFLRARVNGVKELTRSGVADKSRPRSDASPYLSGDTSIPVRGHVYLQTSPRGPSVWALVCDFVLASARTPQTPTAPDRSQSGGPPMAPIPGQKRGRRLMSARSRSKNTTKKGVVRTKGNPGDRGLEPGSATCVH
jgi:hypothetical protein